MDNIFSKSLLVEKYRPQTLDEIVLTKENKKYFVSFKESQNPPNLLFFGNPGTGKTSLAKIIVKDVLGCQYLYINASDENGVEAIRGKVKSFAQTKSIDGRIKICILDECDHLSIAGTGGGSSAQAVLRNLMEEYSESTRFILTGNYKHKIIPALQSRCQDFDLTPPLKDYLSRCLQILKLEKIKIEDSTKKEEVLEFFKSFFPDLRRAINTLQKCTINGELHIAEVATDQNDFATSVLSKIQAKIDITDLRRYVIENEVLFGNDYHSLLSELFEAVYNSNSGPAGSEIKQAALIIIAEGLYRHTFVQDKEINAFATILNLVDCF